ncbi:hypothetical protein EG329_010084 [Mollisiaceae sp. DMI_Dod_QoI]|nr:hypothetical protein EG329_010084 [Helotiales sp. DMI_Dod_QoI]
MLDPLTALSLASSIVQFVDFGIKLVSDGYELYARGSLKSNDEVEQATRDLTQLTQNLAIPSQSFAERSGTATRLPSKDERRLQEIAEACKELGDQLLLTLEELKPRESQNGLESFRKTLRGVKKRGKVQDIEKRLKKMQDQLALHLLAIMNDKQSRLVSTLQDLAEQCRFNEINTSNKIDQLSAQICQALERVEYTRAGRSNLFVNVSSLCQSLTEETARVAATQRLLSSLYFKSIKVRQAAIKEAHVRTLEWIFDDDTECPHPHSSFLRWMQSGNGIFWITGKAGSGKSTLMKYLCSSEKTHGALQSWAGAGKLVMPSYFFWSAGNTMQKSQEGLLQSLLYQILKECEDLAPTICPARWAGGLKSSFLEPWSYEELSEALDSLAKLGQLSTKFCFFVDGLDEYDGEHVEIIKTLKNFASSSSIKLCVSSRPWNVFEKAFGGSNPQKMLLQDFTREDIKRYVENTLEEDDRFVKLMEQDTRYKDLIDEIVIRAEGVFLWVYLVVRSLLRGLTNEDDIETLQLRLHKLPADLEQYFNQMLTTIEDVYQEQTAQIFQITVHARAPLSTLAFYFLEKEKTEPDHAVDAKIGPIPDSEVIAISNKMRTHLNARCKDLIEVNTNYAEQVYMLRYQVDFLHRTVRDFLMTQDMQKLFQSRVAPKFDPRVSLCRIMLAQVKALKAMGFGGYSACKESVKEMFYYAREVEIHNGISEVALLEELDRALQHTEVDKKTTSASQGIWLQQGSARFLAMATEAGLHLYVGHKIDSKSELLLKSPEPLLGLACGLHPSGQSLRMDRVSYGETGIDIDMVHALIDRGADPNGRTQSPDSRTVWEAFLRHCYAHRYEYTRDPPKQIFQTAEMFILHGADPNLSCETHVTEGFEKRNSVKYGPKTVKTIDRHYASPSQILKEVLRPAQYQHISALLVQKRVEKGSSRQSKIWKLVGRK